MRCYNVHVATWHANSRPSSKPRLEPFYSSQWTEISVEFQMKKFDFFILSWKEILVQIKQERC